MDITNVRLIGENSYGYQFKVGQLSSGRWIGYADSEAGAFIFPQVGEVHVMGVETIEQAILLTGAVAETPEHGYGGVEVWHVRHALRGEPADLEGRDSDPYEYVDGDWAGHD